ncbi:TlpA disulfide reductase family protein [Nannocystis sp. RBIL2]|uniref:TlpA family protein disulfide reductase n=1 Tax=Nannocystis sp. RBIL2 TaxID=2996788 RepID=UPI00226E707F|nr:TlpA disulfide reductase family protein [Nannocystis sp. RBIL2]MCY1070346.1 TlpA disulfide reductase family protein [Nannocystis sp. RBIL2]
MRVGILPWLFVLAACGAAADAPAPAAPSPVIATTTPLSTPAPAPAVSAVGGRLRAHDGSPLRTGSFALQRNGFMKPVVSGSLAADGSFRVEVEPGLYTLVIGAVDHAQISRPLLLAGAVEVEGELGTYPRPEPGEVLQLRLQWLDAEDKPLAEEWRPAARTPAGTYRLGLADRPQRAAKLRYQLSREYGTHNGPVADSYESDGGGDFWSVLALAGRDALELDLAALPPAGKPARIEWRGEPPDQRAVRLYRETWEPRSAALQRSMMAPDGKLLEPTAAQRATLAALAAEARAEADAAGDDDTRMLLRLAYLDVFPVLDDPADAREQADWVLARVDPLDPRLGLFSSVPFHLGRVLDTADESFAARAEAWLGHATDHPDAELALAALQQLLFRADARGLDDRVAALYTRVREPRFAGNLTAGFVTKQFDPDRALQPGKLFPDFEFPALAAGAPAVKGADRRGRPYFIEFWATWCGPCVAGMPELHAAYAAVNNLQAGPGEDALRKLGPAERPDIEFVFVSLDQKPGDVEAFRAQQWSMPWTHAIVGPEDAGGVWERFGFMGIPMGVLVDGAGTIVALSNDLRDHELLPTLQQAARATPAAALPARAIGRP